jgi:cholinesterase
LIRSHAIFKVMFFLTTLVGAQATGSDRTSYTALYVFGDSFSDIGARYLDGNGPTAVAYLAQEMGISLTYPKDPNAENKSLNFAAVAATTGEDKSGKWCCQGIMDQVNDFAARVHAGTISFKPETTLFFFEGGLNDPKGATDVTLANLTREIQMLQGLGGRHFTLTLLPTRIPDWAEAAKRLNPAFEGLVAELQRHGVDIRLNHWGFYLDEIMENPSQYGILNTTSPCAGRALFKEDPTPCAKPEAYFYFHSGHPSSTVNKIVGRKLYQELGHPPNSGEGSNAK